MYKNLRLNLDQINLLVLEWISSKRKRRRAREKRAHVPHVGAQAPSETGRDKHTGRDKGIQIANVCKFHNAHKYHASAKESHTRGHEHPPSERERESERER